jgi:hypothetical protein
MADDQNQGKSNQEPVEDGLSALKRLAALDKAGAGALPRGRIPEDVDVVEAIPDWLELLLAKYGEEASMLAGIRPGLQGGPQPIDLTPRAASEESSRVASLLDQMAAEAEVRAPSEQAATSVDWGEAAREEEEGTADEAADWLDRTAKAAPPPPVPPAEEEVPDWLDEISKFEPEAETPAEDVGGGEYSAAEEEVPDWLQELPLPSQPSTAPPEPAAPEAEVPDWLRDLGAVAPQAAETPSASEGEMPDWLEELGARSPDAEPAEAEEAPPVAEGEVPDWLRDLDAAATGVDAGETPQVGEAPSAEPEREAVPDWLAKLAALSAPEEERPSPVSEEAEEESVPSAGAEPSEPALPEVEMEPPPSAEEYAPRPPEEEGEVVEGRLPQAEEEIPDWLRELEAEAALPEPPSPEPEAAAPAEPEAGIPDWLRELEEAEGIPAAEPSPPESPPTPPTEPPPSELAAEAPAEPEPEMPGWLASLRGEEFPLPEPEAEEAPSEEYPQREAAEEPDWLAALRTSGKPDVLALEEEVVEAEEETLPDWLAELRASRAAAEMPPAGLEVPEEAAERPEAEEEVPAEYLPIEAETEVPDWLAEMPAAERPEAEEAEPLPVDAEDVGGEESGILDWLAEIEAAAAAAEEAEGEVSLLEAEAPPAPEEGAVPDWLRQMPPAELPEEAEMPEAEKEPVESPPPSEWLVAEESPEGEEAAPAVEGAVPGEIPDWMREFEIEEEEAAEAREEELGESEGVLAGIPGLLPIAEEEPEGEEEPAATLRSRLGVPVVPDVEGAKLFKEIAAEPSVKPLREIEEKEELETGLEPESRRRRIVETLAWALIFITLIAAIALALLAVLGRVGDLLGGPAFQEFFGSPLVIDPAPVNTFRAQVTKLPPDAVVIVSFDYSPATEAEMGPLAEIILGDLLENQARVVAVSLRPEGPAMAQRLLDRVAAEYPYGQRTLNLGYLPGQTAGVRSLAFLSSAPLFQNWAQSVEDYPAWQDVSGLGDVALIVDVADTPLAVRWWVEQMGPGTLVDRPMVAAVSSAADPTVRPYYNHIDPKAGQLLGLVSGVTGAAAYENRLRQPGRAIESLAAQSVAHLGLVVLSLGGTVVGFRSQAARESGRQAIE